jgi:uncharacterized protein (DUF1800 family)
MKGDHVRYTCLALLALLASAIPAQNAPQIQVHVGTTIVPGSGGVGDTGIVDFGVTAVGQVTPKTFTVKNVGSDPLVLQEAIEVPDGFTVGRALGAQQLAPGRSTTFVVEFNSSRSGRRSGSISVASNSGGRDTITRVSVTGVALPPPSLRIIDDADADFRTVGQWQVAAGQGHQGAVHYLPAGSGANVASWTFSGLKPGRYQVAATWQANADRASNALFTIQAADQTFPAQVDERSAPSDFRDAGRPWKTLLGPTMIAADTLVVRLSDRANGVVVADAIRIERTDFRGQIVDDGDRGFGADGPSTRVDGRGFQNHVIQGDAGSLFRAGWRFDGLQPGLYRVSATWPATATAATNAPFTVTEGNRVLVSGRVNQRLAPRDFRDAGVQWQDVGDLGGLVTITGNALQVYVAAADADGVVLADAIRIENLDDPQANPFATVPDTVRFLDQATWGPNPDLINYVSGIGFDAYLNEQFNAPISTYPDFPLVHNTQMTECHGDPTCNRDNYTLYDLQRWFFYNAIYGSDQLRQRVAWALHHILVVSGEGTLNRPSRMFPYWNIFLQSAFGNFKDILHDITLNPAMGQYLNMRTSTKTLPNENYAREVLQLFSIGLDMLNQNGTLMLDSNGDPIPTYDQTTVTEFARVFTGWHLAAQPRPGYDNYLDPMVSTANLHDTGSKTLLNGRVLPPNQSAATDLNQAITNIFNHQNVAPFICKNLIQQLVTSNPTPAYVGRVTATFRNNGQGVRGDLQAVVYAILMDPEARGDIKTANDYGHMREPALYVNNICRMFTATAYNDSTDTSDGYLNPQCTPMDQDCFRPASVFSYFSPLFVAGRKDDGTPLLAPEFQIYSTSSSIKRANFINQMVNPNGAAQTYGIPTNTTTTPKGTRLVLDPYLQFASDAGALVDVLDQQMMHSSTSPEMKNSIIAAVNAVAANNPLRRVKTAIYLFGTSSQYQIIR